MAPAPLAQIQPWIPKMPFSAAACASVASQSERRTTLLITLPNAVATNAPLIVAAAVSTGAIPLTLRTVSGPGESVAVPCPLYTWPM